MHHSGMCLCSALLHDWRQQQAPSYRGLRMHAGITYKTNTCINAVDLKAKKLTAESGNTFTYEKLIIATGCRVGCRRPAAVLGPVIASRPVAVVLHVE